MPAYQVVEKEYNGTDWQLVRYGKGLLQRYDNEDAAQDAAVTYLTDVNCNNSFTKAEKLAATEVFMMRNGDCFLGVLDGEDWYMTYPKDVMGKDSNGAPVVAHAKGTRINDRTNFLLEGKTEVAVRQLPGS